MLLQVTTGTTGFYMLVKVTTSDYRLNSFLQVIIYPFTVGAPSKNTFIFSDRNYQKNLNKNTILNVRGAFKGFFPNEGTVNVARSRSVWT